MPYRISSNIKGLMLSLEESPVRGRAEGIVVK
jgi:hypothetical protein